MSRPVSLFIFILGIWSAVANLAAQTPARPGASPTPVPSATPPASPSPTATPTPSTRLLIDSMDSADLKEAIQLLKNNYIKPEALNETELSRAAFEGVLARLGRGVILLSDANGEPAEPRRHFTAKSSRAISAIFASAR